MIGVLLVMEPPLPADATRQAGIKVLVMTTFDR